MFSRFDTVLKCHGQTAGRTDGIDIATSGVAFVNECRRD